MSSLMQFPLMSRSAWTNKMVIRYPNNKPWITKELKSVINKKKQTYFTVDPQKRKMASTEVQNEIRRAKAKYKEKTDAVH